MNCALLWRYQYVGSMSAVSPGCNNAATRLWKKCEGINQYQFADSYIGNLAIVTEKVVGLIFQG